MRIVFTGGGTGGHLFPGIALAQNLRGASLFLCTDRPFDARELAAANMDHRVIHSPRLRAGLALPMQMYGAVMTARRHVRTFRPDLVVGLGGYGSFPALIAAKLERLPTVLLEQNVQPGRANRVAASAARRVYAQWAESKRHFVGLGDRFVAAGSPLREGMVAMDRTEARVKLGLDPAGPLVGVVGGSQGADSMNRLVVRELAGTDARVIHLAGASAGSVRDAYAKAGVPARVEEFRRDMATVYSACDLVISRAGALAVAELAALGRAAVLIPYPHAAADHQMANARVLERAGAAAIVDEQHAAPGALAAWVRRLVQGDAVFASMRRAIATFARPDAAQTILSDLLALA